MMGLRTLFGRETSWLGHLPRLHHRLRRRYLTRHTMAVRMSDGLILCRILGPYKFYCDPDDRGISPHILLDGYWEPRTTEAIVDRLKPGMTAIDAGANLGYFTVLMGLLVGPRGRVLSFEPIADSVRRIEGSLLINGLTARTEVHSDALADVDGRDVTIVIPGNFAGGAHVSRGGDGPEPRMQAKTRRLDSVPGAMDAVLIKIDTEGMEEAIWRGMRIMIAGPALRYIVVEFTRDSYEDAGRFLDEVVAAAFRLRRIDDRDGVVPVSRQEILDGPWLQMLLFER